MTPETDTSPEATAGSAPTESGPERRKQQTQRYDRRWHPVTQKRGGHTAGHTCAIGVRHYFTLILRSSKKVHPHR